MNKAIITSLLAVAATASITAYAASATWTSNWDTITVLETYGDDTHVDGLDLTPNPGGCSNTSWARVDYALSLQDKQGVQRVLTAAFLSGKQVKVKLRGDGKCQDGYPAIYAVKIKK